MPSTPLTEHVADWNAALRLDREERLVRNVTLTGVQSRNGYQYTESALDKAVPLYRDKPVFLDHAAVPGRPDRSTRDLVGTITNPRFAQGRIRGDIRVLDTESGRTFLALVEADSPGVGMSHVVLAERSSDGKSVTRIDDVLSVDAVINPATTNTFHEQQCTNSSGRDTDRDPDTTERLRALQQERDDLAARLQALEARTAADSQHRAVTLLIEESTLPTFAITPLFRRQLEATEDEALRRSLIAERQELIAKASHTGPLSHERGRAPQSSSDDQFIRAILRR